MEKHVVEETIKNNYDFVQNRANAKEKQRKYYQANKKVKKIARVL